MELSRTGLVVFSMIGITAVVGGVSLIPSAPIAASPGAADLGSVLASRSPGARAGGALPNKFVTQRVARYVPAAAPSTGTLARERPAVLPVPVAVAGPGVPVGGPVGFVPAGGAAPLPAAVAGPPLVPVAAAPAGGGFPLAGVAGLGALALVPLIFGGGDGDAAVAPPAAPAVPEPDTWLMMMVGFGVLGLALRRRRAAARRPGAAHAAVPQTV